jgi:hypothetical protein
MKKLSVIKVIALTFGCAALAFASSSVNEEDIRANEGATFFLTPTLDPSVFKITADGVARVSLLGDCSYHAEVEARLPASPGQPTVVSGRASFTSADGAATLKFSVRGTGTPNPANPAFVNLSYQATFTGGSGAFASATGTAEINELVKFTSPLAGTATWTMRGSVVTAR